MILFISVFFFTYGKYMEEQIITKQIEYLSENLNNFVEMLGPDVNLTYKKLLTSLKPVALDEQDKQVDDINNNIIQNTIILLFCIIICYGIIMLILFKINLIEYLYESGLILFFIALVEFIFITYIPTQYVNIDINKLKTVLIDKLL